MNEDKTDSQTESSLLVMFPASKNYPKEEIKSIEGLDDPLEDLLNEFEDRNITESEMLWEEVSCDLEKDFPEEERTLTGRISHLKRLIQKIGYYLEEVDQYLPSKK